VKDLLEERDKLLRLLEMEIGEEKQLLQDLLNLICPDILEGNLKIEMKTLDHNL
jgi:hypothetical protein